MNATVSGGMAALGLLVAAATAQAGEVRVISAGAVKSIVTDLAQVYEKETGNKVVMEFGPMVVSQKLASDPADVVIMSDVAIDESIAQGAVVTGSRTDIARTGMGVGVRGRAPARHLHGRRLQAGGAGGQVDRLRRSGLWRDERCPLRLRTPELGIAEQVKPKTKLVPGGYPAELVAKGEVDLVVHQISEILPVKGVTLVGPLPKDVQKVTVYAAGVASKSTSTELARGFIAFITRPASKAKLAEAGLDYRE